MTPPPAHRSGRPVRSDRRRFWLAAGAVLAVAALARGLVISTSSGGLNGLFDYDASVYYAAADAMVHGKAPYSDFALVHPPLTALMLTPAALLGRLTTAETGFAAANLGFLALGSVNAVLVMRVCRRIGLALPAALVGGLFYAVFFGSVQAEFLVKLEPLGNFGFLLFLLLTPAPDQRAGRLRLLCWGLVGGLTCCVKIWWAVPVLLVLVWSVAARRRPRELVLAAAGAAISFTVVLGPFLLNDPSGTWRMIVASQLGRVRTHGGWSRVVQLYSVDPAGDATVHGAASVSLLVAVIAVVAAAVVAAWRAPGARIFIALLAVQVALLLSAPSFFAYYDDFIAVAAAVVLAAAAGAPAVHRHLRRARLAAVATVVVLTAGATISFYPDNKAREIHAFPHGHHAVAEARSSRCIVSDTPMMLIELDALDRSFDHGCRNWVDVTAGVLGVFAARDRATSQRYFQPSWARRLDDYLRSGDAVILERNVSFGASLPTILSIRRSPVIVRSGPWVLHRLR